MCPAIETASSSSIGRDKSIVSSREEYGGAGGGQRYCVGNNR